MSISRDKLVAHFCNYASTYNAAASCNHATHDVRQWAATQGILLKSASGVLVTSDPSLLKMVDGKIADNVTITYTKVYKLVDAFTWVLESEIDTMEDVCGYKHTVVPVDLENFGHVLIDMSLPQFKAYPFSPQADVRLYM